MSDTFNGNHNSSSSGRDGAENNEHTAIQMEPPSLPLSHQDTKQTAGASAAAHVDVEECSKPPPCLKPCVPMYGPINVRNVDMGKRMRWCTCGLSKTQPWCDNSHIGTGFKPLFWEVSGTKKDGREQLMYSICNCKYTGDPPFCDGSHIHLPLKYLKAQRECTEDHSSVKKLCTACGYKPKPIPQEQQQEQQQQQQ